MLKVPVLLEEVLSDVDRLIVEVVVVAFVLSLVESVVSFVLLLVEVVEVIDVSRTFELLSVSVRLSGQYVSVLVLINVVVVLLVMVLSLVDVSEVDSLLVSSVVSAVVEVIDVFKTLELLSISVRLSGQYVSVLVAIRVVVVSLGNTVVVLVHPPGQVAMVIIVVPRLVIVIVYSGGVLDRTSVDSELVNPLETKGEDSAPSMLEEGIVV